MRIMSIVSAVVLAALVAGAVSFTLGRVSHGLCVTMMGKGSTIIVPGRGC